jgi:putative FmdB family regulatory protein
MPTYEYLCKKCGHAFEELQSMSEKPLTHCPKCGTDNLARVMGGGGGFILKGSGFYGTDYRKHRRPGGDSEKKEAGKEETGKKKTGEHEAEKKEVEKKGTEKKETERTRKRNQNTNNTRTRTTGGREARGLSPPPLRRRRKRTETQVPFFIIVAFGGVASLSVASVIVPSPTVPFATKYRAFSRFDFSMRLFAVALPFSSNL